MSQTLLTLKALAFRKEREGRCSLSITSMLNICPGKVWWESFKIVIYSINHVSLQTNVVSFMSL